MANGQTTGELRGGLAPLLFPRSVAIVGPSPRHAEPIASVVRGGRPAWGVHPTRRGVDGLQCVPSFADLPEPPELAFLLVGHGAAEAAFDAAADAGVRAFVVPGLGNESGAEGPPVVERLATRAAELDAAVVGPNCMGVAVPDGPSPWIGIVPETFCRGRVAVVAQSGSVAEACLALRKRVGFRCVVSSGGEMARDVSDFLGFFAEDDETAAIGLFVETVRRPRAFVEALGRCADHGKPVVCLKVGRSPAGARAALAHTGALVGSAEAFSAVLASYGVVEVRDFSELVETLEVLGRTRRPRGRRIAAVSESGGEGALFADHAQLAGIPFAPLPDKLATALRAEFPNFVAPGNPLDAWAIDEPERVYPRCLELMGRSGEFDVLVAQVDVSRYRDETGQDWGDPVLEALADTADASEVFPAVVTVHGVDPPDPTLDLARRREVPILHGHATAARALAGAAGWEARRPRSEERRAEDLGDLLDRGGALPELESARILARYGVETAPSVRAGSPAEAAAAAAALGPPVVVKLDGPAHKSARGGVVLGLATPDAAAAAARELGGRVLVARQIHPGPEAYCGMTRDSDFGPVLAVGRGGTEVEARGPGAVALAPVDRDLALRLAAQAGFDGADALADVLVALGRLAVDHPTIAAVDVNPLILHGERAIAADALVVVAEPVGS